MDEAKECFDKGDYDAAYDKAVDVIKECDEIMEKLEAEYDEDNQDDYVPDDDKDDDETGDGEDGETGDSDGDGEDDDEQEPEPEEEPSSGGDIIEESEPRTPAGVGYAAGWFSKIVANPLAWILFIVILGTLYVIAFKPSLPKIRRRKKPKLNWKGYFDRK